MEGSRHGHNDINRDPRRLAKIALPKQTAKLFSYLNLRTRAPRTTGVSCQHWLPRPRDTHPSGAGDAHGLIVLRLSRRSGEPHEIVYNGPFDVAAAAAGPVGSNGQARISLRRLRGLKESVDDGDRIPRRDLGGSAALDVE
jgi:hypothetical protein